MLILVLDVEFELLNFVICECFEFLFEWERGKLVVRCGIFLFFIVLVGENRVSLLYKSIWEKLKFKLRLKNIRNSFVFFFFWVGRN